MPGIRSFVERFTILCPYLGESTIGGSITQQERADTRNKVCMSSLGLWYGFN